VKKPKERGGVQKEENGGLCSGEMEAAKRTRKGKKKEEDPVAYCEKYVILVDLGKGRIQRETKRGAGVFACYCSGDDCESLPGAEQGRRECRSPRPPKGDGPVHVWREDVKEKRSSVEGGKRRGGRPLIPGRTEN